MDGAPMMSDELLGQLVLSLNQVNAATSLNSSGTTGTAADEAITGRTSLATDKPQKGSMTAGAGEGTGAKGDDSSDPG